MEKSHIIKFVALLLVCSAMLGCGKDKNSGSVYGVVTDFTTGDPVGNATVRLNPGDKTTLTGSDGIYRFDDLADGNYSLFVSKGHYLDLDDDYSIEIENGNSVQRDLQLEPEMPSVISGVVVDSDSGDPLQQAIVTLSPTGMNIYTGSDGTFEFDDLDLRQYIITVQKAGYCTNRKTVTTIPGGVVSVVITLNKINE